MKLKLVTFNIRIQSVEGFILRAGRIADRIKTEDPDVICFQELSTDMQKVLFEKLTDYIFIGGGRNYLRLGEGTPIAYKKNRFVLQEFRTRWLSNTPTVPESTFGGDQSPCPRVYTFALLTDSSSGENIRIYNTHLDHVGKNARFFGAKMLLDDINGDNRIFDFPFVITGDFNAMPSTREIKLISDEKGITDVTDHFEQTFNCYDQPFDYDEESKIDYIFVSDGIGCTDTALWNEKADGEYLSDHFPISAELIL